MVRHKSRSRSRSRDRDRKRRSERTRSRSRDRDRERKKDKDKERRHHAKTSSSSKRSRTRSRSPHSRRAGDKASSSRRDRSSSSSSSERYNGASLTLGGNAIRTGKSSSSSAATGKNAEAIILDPKELEGKSNEEIEMLKVMGFAGFDTTKGKHVDGACNAYAVNIQQKRKYRQYMNRKGGFNKPLDPVA